MCGREPCRATVEQRWDASPTNDRSKSLSYRLTPTFGFAARHSSCANPKSRGQAVRQQTLILSFVGSNPIGGSLVVRPGSDRSIFSVDSGIRLRRRKKSAIAAGPHHRRATDGIRSHDEKAVWPLACHIRGARGSNCTHSPPNSLSSAVMLRSTPH